MPQITKPIPDTVALAIRHAYYAATTWMDHQIGVVLGELERLALTQTTIVHVLCAPVLHGE